MAATAIVIGPGDTAFVLDREQHRISVFDATLKHVDNVVFDAVGVGLVRLESGELVVNGLASTPEGIGFPLHLVARSDRIERSFGSLELSYRPQQNFQRHLAVTPRGTLWTADPLTYLIEEWDKGGRRLRFFRRKPDWLPDSQGAPGGQVAAYVSSVYEDPQGYLWTSSAIRARQTPPVPHARRSETEMPDLSPFDTVIEVFAPRGGKLMATLRLERRLIGFVAGLCVELKDDGDNVAVQIYRQILRQP